MRVLGVDPGSRATGWAVVDFAGVPTLAAAGVLRPSATSPLVERLRALHSGLLAVVESQAVDLAAVERVFSGVNPQSLITLGEARGVLLLALAERDVPTAEITPAEVKRAVTGTGAAEKEQVRRMVTALLAVPAALRRLPLDAADAAAIALAHGQRAVTKGARLRAATPTPPSAAPSGSGWRRRPAG